ncbi:hypothetical protein EBT31_16575 [bacterium]|nr:hypothetical protein [bacterium]
MRAALQLYANGHVELASDLKQLASKWTPADELVLVDDQTATINASTFTITNHAPTTDTRDNTD